MHTFNENKCAQLFDTPSQGRVYTRAALLSAARASFLIQDFTGAFQQLLDRTARIKQFHVRLRLCHAALRLFDICLERLAWNILKTVGKVPGLGSSRGNKDAYHNFGLSLTPHPLCNPTNLDVPKA